MYTLTQKSASLLILFLAIFINIQAQIPESCDCAVDINGYDAFIDTLNPDEDAVFQFHVQGTFAVAYGLIGSTTPSVVQNLINNYPNVTTIVMHSCPGSEDDDANLEASLLIYNAGYKMYLPVDGWVASGAVDMFLAGSVRVIDVTYDPVGVHSWSDGTNDATDYPVGHAEHQPYIDYYMDIGFTQLEAENFYYFTINAAPADDIYWMTDAEMDQYKIRTCRYANNPTYSVTQTATALSANIAGASYQWVDCNNANTPIVGETNQTFSPTQNGNYAVQITEDNCNGISNCYAITALGVSENAFKNNIKVFPNPSNGGVSITLNKNSATTCTILDLKGSVLQKNTFNSKNINLNTNIPAGVYFLKIESGQDNTTIKLVLK